MKEDCITGNQLIEKAIAGLVCGSSGEGVMAVLEALQKRMTEDGHLLIPVELPQDAAGALELAELKGGAVVNAREELRFVLRKLRLGDGKEALTAFTSREEAAKGQPTSIITFPIKHFMETAAETDIQGIVINPWGRSFFLPKEVIGMLLASGGVGQAQNHIYIKQGDITELDCDCIVNAANKSLLGGDGVDGAIHRAAGPELLEECRGLHGCETGEAKITGGGRLKAKYVIHTVGPVYDGSGEDEALLEDCYWNSLELAKANHLHSIAFPAISTGAYGYPPEEAVLAALSAVTGWLHENKDYGMTVILCCFDRAMYDRYQEFVNNCSAEPE